ncbi:MAG: FmdB family zinc ribbon protein [Planctomycetota bacterium]|jgi:putative FmdB family regulatory protein
MPTYEYLCEECNHELEKFQSITARPLRKCPKCGKPKLKRLLGTGAGIIFKGSGFYETDYRSENYKKASEKEKNDLSTTKKEKNADTKTKSPETSKKPSQTTKSKEK